MSTEYRGKPRGYKNLNTSECRDCEHCISNIDIKNVKSSDQVNQLVPKIKKLDINDQKNSTPADMGTRIDCSIV
jgi:deoxycytidylate deaminase